MTDSETEHRTATQSTAKPRITLPVIVEGRYDKSTLTSLFDVTVLVTGGFSLFNAKERQALFRRVAGERGVIVLTDPDGGGRQIRAFLSGILPPEKVHHLYIPEIHGKEKRKAHTSRAGLLGVEGVGREVLERAFAPFIEGDTRAEKTTEDSGEMLTKVIFYEDGFSGGENASARRDALAARLSLPRGMSAKALYEALRLVVPYREYRDAVNALRKEEREKKESTGQ